MENTLLHNVSLGRFKELFRDFPCVGMGDDFFIMDVSVSGKPMPLNHPCRFDGFMIIYCLDGHVRLSVNLEEIELREGMLFFNFPGSIIKVNDVSCVNPEFRYVCIAMSKEFVGGLRLDTGKIFTGMIDRGPVMSLDAEGEKLLGEHIRLISYVMNSSMPNRTESVHSILSSIFYMLAGICAEKNKEEEDASNKASGRSGMMFRQFIHLVSEHHTRHRNVGFYADRLCLTPKYLSRLVKEASGRSAPQWIDAYVILEAKNLLKCSGMTIKEIVYNLNFPNQSMFYKFFKARTGMTPSEYRKS